MTLKTLITLSLVLFIIVVVYGQESDFEKRYSKYIRCKQTHKPSDEELELYSNTDSICRQKAKHAFGVQASDDFHNKINCVNHCIRNHRPMSYGDHIAYCVGVVDDGTYPESECVREF